MPMYIHRSHPIQLHERHASHNQPNYFALSQLIVRLNLCYINATTMSFLESKVAQPWKASCID
jgi:hypothetical protein